MAVIECVPNFSEGRDAKVVEQIVCAINSVQGVHVLHVDMGFSANRTVVTFAGEPEAVVEGAFQGIKQAAKLIDMRKHHGTHPRMGATDVCPLIPVSGSSMEETVQYARDLGKRVGDDLDIPVYLYEYAASRPERRNLAYIRQGGYEKLPFKLQQMEWTPDFGPARFNEKAGATVIGARDFLLAYNINLDTDDVAIAKAIARDVRRTESIKAIGWYMEEYKMAQVSMNLTSLKQIPLYVAFETVKEQAEKRGVKVAGSELIGLTPLSCLIEAGPYFIKKATGAEVRRTEAELIAAAVEALGLDALKPFDPQERVLEYVMHKYNASS